MTRARRVALALALCTAAPAAAIASPGHDGVPGFGRTDATPGGHSGAHGSGHAGMPAAGHGGGHAGHGAGHAPGADHDPRGTDPGHHGGAHGTGPGGGGPGGEVLAAFGAVNLALLGGAMALRRSGVGRRRRELVARLRTPRGGGR